MTMKSHCRWVSSIPYSLLGTRKRASHHYQFPLTFLSPSFPRRSEHFHTHFHLLDTFTLTSRESAYFHTHFQAIRTFSHSLPGSRHIFTFTIPGLPIIYEFSFPKWSHFNIHIPTFTFVLLNTVTFSSV